MVLETYHTHTTSYCSNLGTSRAMKCHHLLKLCKHSHMFNNKKQIRTSKGFKSSRALFQSTFCIHVSQSLLHNKHIFQFKNLQKQRASIQKNEIIIMRKQHFGDLSTPADPPPRHTHTHKRIHSITGQPPPPTPSKQEFNVRHSMTLYLKYI